MARWFEEKMRIRRGTYTKRRLDRGGADTHPKRQGVSVSSSHTECSHHDCQETRGLKKCKYCSKLYCPEHVEATLPSPHPGQGKITGIPNQVQKGRFRGELDESWRREGGHPCAAYFDVRFGPSTGETDTEREEVEEEVTRTPYTGQFPIPMPEKKPPRMPTPKSEPKSTPEKLPESGFKIEPKTETKHPPELVPVIKGIEKLVPTLRIGPYVVGGLVALAIILVAVLAFITLVSYAAFSEVTVYETHDVNKTRAVVSYENSSNAISFQEYLVDSYVMTNEKRWMNGSLEHKIRWAEGVGTHEFYLKDDYTNRVLLLGKGNDLYGLPVGSAEKEQLYSIYGVLEKSNGQLKLNAETIVRYEREPIRQIEMHQLEEYTEQVTTNKTRPAYPVIRTIVYRLLQKEVLCEDNTTLNECSKNKPLFCDIDGLRADPGRCGCPSGMRGYEGSCIPEVKCSDGTYAPECSKTLKMQCVGGTLVYNAAKCGCPDDFRVQGNTCIKIQRCADRTLYGDCAPTKPKFCDNGVLVDKAGVCGCTQDFVIQGDTCVPRFETYPKTVTFHYTLRGTSGSISTNVYGGLSQYLSSKSRTFTCYVGSCPSEDEMTLSYLVEPTQQPYLSAIADKIEAITSNKDDQARIAISLVQTIPYDMASFTSGDLKGRYPYEVVYDQTGVCGEKSQLLAALLKELGFGVALLRFDVENHMTVGIECPSQYTYKSTGYCFIETARETIPTDSSREYVGAGQLLSNPHVIVVSDGLAFSSIGEEYNDAVTYNRIMSMGQVLSQSAYYTWYELSEKYGLPTS